MEENDKPKNNLARYSDWLDTRFRIPGTNIRFGLDFLIGLFPVVGDIVTFSLSGGLILLMIKKGASGRALSLMIVNVVLDSTLGSIPVVGDIFDLFFKSNKRNLDLFQAHFLEGKHQGSAWPVIWTVLVLILVMLFFVLWLTIKALSYLILLV